MTSMLEAMRLLNHSRGVICFELTLTPEQFVEYCSESGFYQLPLSTKHVLVASSLDISKVDKVHRDPFDRLLLSQAKAENYSFLTHDPRMPLYKEKCTIMV